MVLTTVEKVFIVEHYFRSYGIGRAGGPSLSYTTLRFQDHFHKNPPGNAVILGSLKNVEEQSVAASVTVKRSLMRTSLKLTEYLQHVNAKNPEFSEYCASMLSICYEEPAFLSDVWFRDESHVYLNCFINKQTTGFLGFERPDIVVERFCLARPLLLNSQWFQKDMAQPVTLPLTTLLSSNKPLATVSSPLEHTFLTQPTHPIYNTGRLHLGNFKRKHFPRRPTIYHRSTQGQNKHLLTDHCQGSDGHWSDSVYIQGVWKVWRTKDLPDNQQTQTIGNTVQRGYVMEAGLGQQKLAGDVVSQVGKSSTVARAAERTVGSSGSLEYQESRGVQATNLCRFSHHTARGVWPRCRQEERSTVVRVCQSAPVCGVSAVFAFLFP
ncbi:hypothetical protein J6590_084532 [Homalodisca vitripennis]|nr:hypothetical protein J6590_084532 [Homalodisca vitripennis]